MKYTLTIAFAIASCLQANAQFDYEPKDGDPYLTQPSHQVEYRWNTNANMWDSVSVGTLMYTQVGLLPDMEIQPTQGSVMAHPARYTRIYDGLGNMTMQTIEEDPTGQGNWVFVSRMLWEFLPGTDLVTAMASLSFNGTTFDTVSAQRFSYLLGPGGEPVEKSISIYGAGSWSVPQLWERYHYSVTQEMDTLWYYPLGVDSAGSEMHVFHSWHHYGMRLSDTATVYWIEVNGGPFELAQTHRTLYSGNIPQLYTMDSYRSTGLTARRILSLTADGNWGLDSLVSFPGAPVVFSKWEYLTSFDSQNRYVRRIRFATAGNGPFEPVSMMEYLYLATALEPATPSTWEMVVWPNPVHEMLQVQLPENHSGAVAVRVMDMNGRVRLSQSLTTTASKLKLDLGQNLPSGTYLVQVQTPEGSACQKVILER